MTPISPLSVLPPPLYSRLQYSPRSWCNFSDTGSKMVEDLIRLTPTFNKQFNMIMPLSSQVSILQRSFSELSEEWKAQQLQIEQCRRDKSNRLFDELDLLEEKELLSKGKKSNKSFYEKQWRWKGFVPPSYRRSLAPRITTSGGTLHAMKKDMSKHVLKLALTQLKDSCFIDIDFLACHAHIAASLKEHLVFYGKNVLMEAVTHSAKFWDEQASKYVAIFDERNVSMKQSAVRSILKVSFYTALNGGNPLNAVRMASNLKGNSPDLLMPFSTLDTFGDSSLFMTFQEVLKDMELLQDVKELNKLCVNRQSHVTFTVDRTEGYSIDSDHKGISRVLQGIEVVLLSVLVPLAVNRGCLPINLAHDGVLVMVRDHNDPETLCQQLSADIAEWSRFLLHGLEIRIEPKFWVSQGELLTPP